MKNNIFTGFKYPKITLFNSVDKITATDAKYSIAEDRAEKATDARQ